MGHECYLIQVGPRVSYVRLQVHMGLSYILYLLARIRGFHTYCWHILCFHSYSRLFRAAKKAFTFQTYYSFICSFSRVHLLLQMGFSYWHGLLTVLSVVMGSNNTSTSGTYWTFMNTTGTYCIVFLI
jgi:hypothetical protein